MWIKIDDQMPDHPKVARVGVLGFAMHVAAICYCARHYTDGFVPDGVVDGLLNCEGVGVYLDRFAGDDAQAKYIVPRMEEAGLWERDDERGGWWVHDYLDYNPSAAEVQKNREEARVRAGRRRLNRNDKSEARPNGDRVPAKSASSSREPRENFAENSITPSPSPSQIETSSSSVVTKQAEAGLGVIDDEDEDAALKLQGRTAKAADLLAEHDLQQRVQTLGPPDKPDAYRNTCRDERIRRNGRRLIELTEAEPGWLAGRLADRILEEEQAERDEQQQQRVARPDPYRPPDFKPEGVGQGVPMPPDVKAQIDKALGRHRVDDKLAEGEP